MHKEVTEAQADSMIKLALGCWILSCIYGPLGIIAQTFLIIRLIWMCDVKVIPALIIAHYTGANISFLRSQVVLLRLGILVSPATVCIFAMFGFVLMAIFRGRYDNKTLGFITIWIPAIFPAFYMSLTAYFNNMRSIWTWPIFDVLVPSGCLWAVLAGRTWEAGKRYFLTRMLVLFSLLAIFRALTIFRGGAFSLTPAVICLLLISLKLQLGLRYTLLASLGAAGGLFTLIFSNYFAVEAETGYAGTAELGSSFTNVGVCVFAVGLAVAIKNRIIPKVAVRVLPYVMIVLTTSVLLYAVSTRQNFGLVSQDYQTIQERWNAKLFNDRGTVWGEGLEEAKTPPYFIKDLRAFIDFNAVIGKDEEGRYITGYGLKLLPHNQVLTLLGRDGWWLGGVLCLFMWWMHIRAVKAALYCSEDPVFMIYFLPVSMALFHILGLTGQSTCSAAIQNHGFESTIVCGILYGAASERARLVSIFRGR